MSPRTVRCCCADRVDGVESRARLLCSRRFTHCKLGHDRESRSGVRQFFRAGEGALEVSKLHAQQAIRIEDGLRGLLILSSAEKRLDFRSKCERLVGMT